MQKRYIKLKEEESKILHQLKKEGLSERIRDRSHALLLSNKRYSVAQISSIFEVRQATILEWLNRWESKGLEGIVDLPKSGRPRIFKEKEEKKF
jgi:transposase